MDAFRVIERYRDAMNARDLEALVDCFEADYESVQPLNPDRNFHGRETVRERWTAIFSEVPDFTAELLRAAAADQEVWGEWRWHGTRADGTRVDVHGVTILSVRDDRFAWGRFYLEEAAAGGGGMHVESSA